MEDTQDKTAATTAKARTPEQKARRKLARKMALAFWKVEYLKANPKADKAALKSAWGDARRAKTKAALAALRQMEKEGFRIVLAIEASREAA